MALSVGRVMRLTELVSRALHAQPEICALAWVDLHRGVVLAASLREGASMDALESATGCAMELCKAPVLDGKGGESDPFGEESAREAVVVSASAVHAYACSKNHPSRAVVGVACGGASVALLLASVRSVADSLEAWREET